MRGYIVDTCPAVYRQGDHCSEGDSFGGDWSEGSNCRRDRCEDDKYSGIAMSGSINIKDDRSGCVRYECDLCEGYRKIWSRRVLRKQF